MLPITIISEAYVLRVFTHDWDVLSNHELKHISSMVDYRKVPDRIISDNKEVFDVIDWNRMDKMQLIRIISRCLDQNFNVVDIIKKSNHNYKVKDLKHLLFRRPEYIQHFDIDLNKLKTSEAASLLSLGHDYYLKNIDTSKYKFNFNESMSIIQAYDYDRSIIERVNYHSLKGYQISEILLFTGTENMDILDLEKMNSTDWFNLVSKRSDMYKYCDYNKFLNSDIYHSIQLFCAFDNDKTLDLILSRDLSKITPLGWEKLLIKKPEKFLAHCYFYKLESINWSSILSERPELISYKTSL